MTIAEAYLGGSQVFRRLKNGPHGQLIERYAARLVEDDLARQGTWRCLNVVGGLLSWMASHRIKVTDLNETRVERYLRDRGNRQTIQPGDRAALKRWLSVQLSRCCAPRVRLRRRCSRRPRRTTMPRYASAIVILSSAVQSGGT